MKNKQAVLVMVVLYFVFGGSVFWVTDGGVAVSSMVASIFLLMMSWHLEGRLFYPFFIAGALGFVLPIAMLLCELWSLSVYC